jgi:hypothetical protein
MDKRGPNILALMREVYCKLDRLAEPGGAPSKSLELTGLSVVAPVSHCLKEQVTDRGYCHT